MMKRFEAVIFDMDGVIFDSELLVIKCWQVVADKYGIKNIEDTCHKCLGLNKDATKELMLGVYGAPVDPAGRALCDKGRGYPISVRSV